MNAQVCVVRWLRLSLFPDNGGGQLQPDLREILPAGSRQGAQE